LTSGAMQKVWERRDRLHIMAEIMEATKESQLKTRIMYRANLSFSQVNEYLSFLTEKRFLRAHIENGKRLYETTAKGNQYIENYKQMSNLLRQRQFDETKSILEVNTRGNPTTRGL
jgi:predicted transcriptional regulator